MSERRATSDPPRTRPAVVVTAVAACMFVVVGLVAIVFGATSAQAGWWLIAVGILLIAVLAMELNRR